MVVAKHDAATADAPSPPGPLAAVARFTRLPERALLTVREVLDADEAFRARVTARADLDALSPGARLFLERPAGWEQELAMLVGAASDDLEHRRVEVLVRQVDDLRRELDQAGRRVDARARREQEAADHAARVERELAGARRRLEAAEARAVAAEEERARAVRQLKEAEALASRRLQRVRELEAGAAGRLPAGGAHRTTEAVDRLQRELRRALGELAGAADQARSLADRLGAAARPAPELDEAGTAGGGSAGRGDGRRRSRPAPDGTAAATSGARVPRRMRRGVVADSPDGLAQLMQEAGMVVLVDGYNVSMRGWPDQGVARQRQCLLDVLGGLTAGRPAEVHVVFDGAGAGDRPAVGAPLPVRVHFTEAGVEADDRLIEYAGRVPSDRPVTVVSSDRRVQAGARRAGANVVSADALLALARR